MANGRMDGFVVIVIVLVVIALLLSAALEALMMLAAKKVVATGWALQAAGQGPPVEEILVIATVIVNSVNALHRER